MYNLKTTFFLATLIVHLGTDPIAFLFILFRSYGIYKKMFVYSKSLFLCM
jgi:hypothetical protein